MKLVSIIEDCISEDAARKLADKIAKYLHDNLGGVIEDTDALFDFIKRGLNTYRYELIIYDDRWWSKLADFLSPIDPKFLEKTTEKTFDYIKDLLERGAKGERVLDEGILSGLVSLFSALGKLLIAAFASMMDAEAVKLGIPGDRIDKKKLEMRMKSQLNCKAIGYFLEEVTSAVNRT